VGSLGAGIRGASRSIERSSGVPRRHDHRRTSSARTGGIPCRAHGGSRSGDHTVERVGALMFVAGNALSAVATILDYVLWLYMWVIIARALISWVNPDPWNPILQFLNRATEPVLAPIRRMIGVRIGMDVSPIVAILIITFLQIAVVQSLKEFAMRMN